MPTLCFRNGRSPFGGGAYLRLLPYWFTRWGIRFLNETEGRSACVYIHPWELDPEQPRMAGDLTARLRHYLGLRGMEKKLVRLMKDFQFAPLGDLVEELKLADAVPHWPRQASRLQARNDKAGSRSYEGERSRLQNRHCALAGRYEATFVH